GGRRAAECDAGVLGWKGRVAGWGRLNQIALDEPELKDDVKKFRAARARLAWMALRTPEPAQQAGWLKEVQKLTDEAESLEAELARKSARFRAQKDGAKLTPEQLAKQLPEGVAFVDLIEYDHQIPPKDGKGSCQAELRLLAFVSRRGKEVVAVPLGAQKPVADAVARWRAEVEKEPTK